MVPVRAFIRRGLAELRKEQALVPAKQAAASPSHHAAAWSFGLPRLVIFSSASHFFLKSAPGLLQSPYRAACY
jgi:hypothetical protein